MLCIYITVCICVRERAITLKSTQPLHIKQEIKVFWTIFIQWYTSIHGGQHCILFHGFALKQRQVDIKYWFYIKGLKISVSSKMNFETSAWWKSSDTKISDLILINPKPSTLTDLWNFIIGQHFLHIYIYIYIILFPT